MTELRILYAYKDPQGQEQRAEISDLVTEFSIKTTLEPQPGVLNLTAIADGFEFILGAAIKVFNAQKEVFSGFIFSVSQTKAKTLQIVAYDALRYLKNTDTFVFGKGLTASDIFKKVCERFELETGEIDKSEWSQPPAAHEDANAFDIIREAIENALPNEKRFFVLIPEGRKIHFKDITSLQTDILIDEEQGQLDYNHNANIDQSTYNQIKILAEDSKKWKVYRSDDNVKQWGLLQYSQKFGEPVKDKDLGQILDKLAALHDKPQQTLSITCVGNWLVRAGTGVHVRFKDFKNFDQAQGYYVRECNHVCRGASHEMRLDLASQNLI